MFRALSVFWTLLFDKRTPLSAKIIIAAGALYGISPLDVIPDILPLIGVTDDLAVIVAALAIFYWKTKGIRTDLKKKS